MPRGSTIVGPVNFTGTDGTDLDASPEWQAQDKGSGSSEINANKARRFESGAHDHGVQWTGAGTPTAGQWAKTALSSFFFNAIEYYSGVGCRMSGTGGSRQGYFALVSNDASGARTT